MTFYLPYLASPSCSYGVARGCGQDSGLSPLLAFSKVEGLESQADLATCHMQST